MSNEVSPDPNPDGLNVNQDESDVGPHDRSSKAPETPEGQKHILVKRLPVRTVDPAMALDDAQSRSFKLLERRNGTEYVPRGLRSTLTQLLLKRCQVPRENGLPGKYDAGGSHGS